MDLVLAAIVCAAVGGLGGWFVPRLIAVVPEPRPEPDEERSAHLVKERYTEIAVAPGLGIRCAITSAVVGAGFGIVQGWVWPLVYLVPLVPFGVTLAVIDTRTRLLPTRLLAPAYPVLVALVLLCGLVTGDGNDLRRAGYGWLLMGGFYLSIWLLSGRLLGYGDVRLSGLLGIALGYLGWGELVVGMLLAFPLLGVPPLVLAVARWDRSILQARVAFGPAMLVSAAVGVVVGAAVGDWYLGTAGFST